MAVAISSVPNQSATIFVKYNVTTRKPAPATIRPSPSVSGLVAKAESRPPKDKAARPAPDSTRSEAKRENAPAGKARIKPGAMNNPIITPSWALSIPKILVISPAADPTVWNCTPSPARARTSSVRIRQRIGMASCFVLAAVLVPMGIGPSPRLIRPA